MNITKNNKIKPDISAQSKSFLIISTNYQIETLYHILIKNPNLVNTKDQKNETFLSYAIKRKNVEIAELILTSPKLDYSYQDQNGNSYLHLAVINQLENIIRILIKKGINVNLQNNDGNTALHFAYSTGDIKFITIIIESKADFTIKNKNGIIAEEIAPGTFPEILDINNSVNNNNNISVTHNKNNTVTINLNADNDNDNNCKEKDKDNNIIINERGQINKSIKINWEENGISDNIYNNNVNTSSNVKINNNITNNNQFENTSKSKLKYSLVDFSYSEDGEEEEENGVIPNKLSSSKKQYINESNDNKNGKDVKSSDIFDLTSSLSYQEKVANASLINAHVVNELDIEKKESSDSAINDDIVNINKIRITHNHPTPSLNKIAQNNFINNPIEMSQQSFQTTEENRRNMILSKENNENGNQIKSNIFKNEEMKKGNGQNINYDNSTSVKKENNNYDYDDNDILNKQDSGGICNYNNNNLNQSNTFRPQLEINQDFAFSPITTLKEPLNKNKSNGSEVNNASNNINKQLNEMNNLNSNLNNLKNININNEKTGNKKVKENMNNNFNINNNSFTTSLKRNNDIKDKNIINGEDNKNIYSNMSLNQNYNIYSNLPQNGINSNSNSKMDYNYQVGISKESVGLSMSKHPRDQLYKFLSEIKMDKYYDIMNKSGFDDIQLLINQTKSINAISDIQLKEAGINLPGDRAKILIRLQEKAGNFIFPVPKEVYYICQSDNIKSDRNINKLYDWLKSLKIENYLECFIKNGYHSIELLLLQMESKNPLTDEILKNELGITKIGHRSRIINKLIEEGKSLNNKLKTTMLIVGNAMSEKICDCIIF